MLFLGSYQKIYSQNVEQKVLELLYNDIKKQSEYCLIKEKMKGASLVADPISGEKEIKYSANIDAKIKADFEKFSKEEQVKILSCNNYPVSLKDTLIIIDTVGFFSEGNIAFNQRKTVVNIVRKYPKQTCSNCMILFAVGIRHNSLIVTLNNKKQNKQLYNYYFDLSSSGIELKKISIIDNKVSLE